MVVIHGRFFDGPPVGLTLNGDTPEIQSVGYVYDDGGRIVLDELSSGPTDFAGLVRPSARPDPVAAGP